MKSTTLFQAGCGVLACLAVESAALPSPGGGGHNRVRPRHSTTGDATKTVLLTVSVGPSTTVTIPPCTDEGESFVWRVGFWEFVYSLRLVSG